MRLPVWRQRQRQRQLQGLMLSPEPRCSGWCWGGRFARQLDEDILLTIIGRQRPGVYGGSGGSGSAGRVQGCAPSAMAAMGCSHAAILWRLAAVTLRRSRCLRLASCGDLLAVISVDGNANSPAVVGLLWVSVRGSDSQRTVLVQGSDWFSNKEGLQSIRSHVI